MLAEDKRTPIETDYMILSLVLVENQKELATGKTGSSMSINELLAMHAKLTANLKSTSKLQRELVMASGANPGPHAVL